MSIQIQNSDVRNELVDKARLNITDDVPSKLGETIVPVLECTPTRQIRSLTGNATNVTSTTIFTTSPTKRTFLVGAAVSVVKDGTATSTNSSINAFPRGQAVQTMILIPTTTLTIESGLHAEMSFHFPIELEKNTAVTINNSTNVGNITARGIVFFYEVDK